MHVESQKDSPRNATKFFRGQAQLISEHWSWNPTNSLQSIFRSNLSELKNQFSVDYYLAYLSTTNFYDKPMFESRNICDLGLLQNARTHGPRGIAKAIEKPILHRTQVHYFCSGNSNQDEKGDAVQEWRSEGEWLTWMRATDSQQVTVSESLYELNEKPLTDIGWVSES